MLNLETGSGDGAMPSQEGLQLGRHMINNNTYQIRSLEMAEHGW